MKRRLLAPPPAPPRPVRKSDPKKANKRHDFSAALEAELLKEVQAAEQEAEITQQQQETLERENEQAAAELYAKEKELMKKCMEILRVGNNGEIVGREQEIAKINSFIEESVDKASIDLEGDALYISGVPGVGKTLATSHVLYRREEESTLLNCMTCVDNPTPATVLKAILEALPAEQNKRAKMQRGAQSGVKGLLDKLEKRVKSLEQPFILVLDEVDFFCKKKKQHDATFAKIFGLPRHGPLTLIGIANSIGLLDQQKTICNELEQVQDLVFRPYGAEQMKQIILSRLDQVTKEGIFGPQTLEFLADRASKYNNGDCRKALELSARALDEMKDRRFGQHNSTISSARSSLVSSFSTGAAQSVASAASSSTAATTTALKVGTSKASSSSSSSSTAAAKMKSSAKGANEPRQLIGLDIAQDVVMKSMSPMEQIAPTVKALPQMQQVVLMCFCCLVSGVNDQGITLEYDNPMYDKRLGRQQKALKRDLFSEGAPGVASSPLEQIDENAELQQAKKQRKLVDALTSAFDEVAAADAKNKMTTTSGGTNKPKSPLTPGPGSNTFKTPQGRGKKRTAEQAEPDTCSTTASGQDHMLDTGSSSACQTNDRLREALIANGAASAKKVLPMTVQNSAALEKTAKEQAIKRCLSPEEVLKILKELCQRGKAIINVQASALNLRSTKEYLSMLDETPLLRQVSKGGKVRRELAYPANDVLRPILQKNPQYQDLFLDKKLGITRVGF
ncbi:unnamed protein product [Amoebophrya sp. A120]|nr:unnamed protein product [Amoebophrya sp. A120]|eukprot:GSA120T00003073001.1